MPIGFVFNWWHFNWFHFSGFSWFHFVLFDFNWFQFSCFHFVWFHFTCSFDLISLQLIVFVLNVRNSEVELVKLPLIINMCMIPCWNVFLYLSIQGIRAEIYLTRCNQIHVCFGFVFCLSVALVLADPGADSVLISPFLAGCVSVYKMYSQRSQRHLPLLDESGLHGVKHGQWQSWLCWHSRHLYLFQARSEQAVDADADFLWRVFQNILPQLQAIEPSTPCFWFVFGQPWGILPEKEKLAWETWQFSNEWEKSLSGKRCS